MTILSILCVSSIVLADITYTDDTMPSGNISTTTTDSVIFHISNLAAYSSVISGNGTVTKNGNGTLTLSNANNTFTGDVYINSGTVVLAAGSASASSLSCLGQKVSGRTVYINSGAELNLAAQDSFNTAHVNNPIVIVFDGSKVYNTISINGDAYNYLQHTVFKNGAELYASEGSPQYKAYKLHDVTIARNGDNSPAAPVTFSSDLSKVNATIGFGDISSVIQRGQSVSTIKVEEVTSVNSSINDGVSDLVISAIIANPCDSNYYNHPPTSIIKSGVGTMEFTAPNTYTGPMKVSAGTLKFTDDAIVANGTVTVEENATVEYNVSNGKTKLLTVASANKISGDGNLVKTGDGTLQIFTAASGLIQAESFVVSSGRLDMQGYFSGTLTVEDDATFSPGNSNGESSFTGDYILNDNGKLLLEIAGSDYTDNDILIVAGNIVLNAQGEIDGDIDLALYGNALADGPFWFDVVIGANNNDDISKAIENAIVKTFDWPFSNITVKQEGTISSSYTGDVTNVKAYHIRGLADPNAVPEPSTWALLALGVAGLMYWRKRKN